MTDAGRRPVTAHDLTRLRGVSDPQISPDGRRVAFVMTTASEERDEYISNVWVVAADGGEPRRFTAGPTRDTLPRWSPDGRWLAFVSDRGPKKKSQLYAMPADGGEAIQLAEGRSNPCLSHDHVFASSIACLQPEIRRKATLLKHAP